jgi:hypothetical protein
MAVSINYDQCKTTRSTGRLVCGAKVNGLDHQLEKGNARMRERELRE